MKGLAHKEEYQAVAKACAAHDFYLEPTGGIDLITLQKSCRLLWMQESRKIIPHVYSSIIDPETGDTRPERCETITEDDERFIEVRVKEEL